MVYTCTRGFFFLVEILLSKFLRITKILVIAIKLFVESNTISVKEKQQKPKNRKHYAGLFTYAIPSLKIFNKFSLQNILSLKLCCAIYTTNTLVFYEMKILTNVSVIFFGCEINFGQ